MNTLVFVIGLVLLLWALIGNGVPMWVLILGLALMLVGLLLS